MGKKIPMETDREEYQKNKTEKDGFAHSIEHFIVQVTTMSQVRD